MHGLSDTDPKVAQMRVELLRRKGPGERLRMMGDMSEAMIRLSRQTLEHKLGNTPEARLEWIRLNYGAEFAKRIRKATVGQG